MDVVEAVKRQIDLAEYVGRVTQLQKTGRSLPLSGALVASGVEDGDVVAVTETSAGAFVAGNRASSDMSFEFITWGLGARGRRRLRADGDARRHD